MKASDQAIEYGVLGLPPGHQAIIALAHDGWQILHGTEAIPGEWVGAYETAARLRWRRCRKRLQKITATVQIEPLVLRKTVESARPDLLTRNKGSLEVEAGNL